MKIILIFILKILADYSEDLLILCGLTMIVTATFLINFIAGIYTLGFIFLVMGLALARIPPRKAR